MFESFHNYKYIAIDLETHDPDLKKSGPGVRTNGYSVGYAIATPDWKAYYAFRHAEGNNCSKKDLLDYIKNELKKFKGSVVFANALYDLDYMAEDGIPIDFPILDIQIAEPLIDENAVRYNLQRLGEKYLGVGKTEDLMVAAYGKNFKSNMAATDGSMAGVYAADDAALTLSVWQKQKPILFSQGLNAIFSLESQLTPLLLYMRRVGVRIDLAAADALSNQFYLQEKKLLRQLEKLTGMPFYRGDCTVWQNAAIGRAFDAAGLEYPLSPTGKPSFRQQWLEYHDSELAKTIVEIRRLNKLNNTFIKNAILGKQINGRIHTTFNQVRGDGTGTVTGRLSSTHPNLQQVPKHSEYGAQMRALFIPEETKIWGSLDYAQIEYRLLVHYAYVVGAPGAHAVIQQYKDNPAIDYHGLVQELVKKELGKEIERTPIKGINFGLIYGMGAAKLGLMLGMEKSELEEFLAAYNTAIPFAAYMRREVNTAAARRGYICTLLGRYRRFPKWETREFEQAKEDGAFDFEEAKQLYGRYKIRRAYTYKALNALIQGSAADLMKKAMVDIWESGILSCHGGNVDLHLTVHDELGFSVPRGDEASFMAVKNMMEGALNLYVPIVAEGATGKNWSEAK